MSFTVFGLWLVVVQLWRRDWAARWRRRWGAQAVAMHFALPGFMSLLNLVNPDSRLLWRVSFAAFAVVGGVGVALLDRPTDGRDGVQRLAHWTGVALYGAVALVAVFADGVARVFGARPLQVEAVLLTVLLFVGVNMAFSALFAEEPLDDGQRGS